MIITKSKLIYHISEGGSRVELTVDYINQECSLLRTRLEQHSTLDKRALAFGETVLDIHNHIKTK